MVTVNVVVLAGTIATEPVRRSMPSGDEVTELRVSVPEQGRRLLPLPVAAWHVTVGDHDAGRNSPRAIRSSFTGSSSAASIAVGRALAA